MNFPRTLNIGCPELYIGRETVRKERAALAHDLLSGVTEGSLCPQPTTPTITNGPGLQGGDPSLVSKETAMANG